MASPQVENAQTPSDRVQRRDSPKTADRRHSADSGDSSRINFQPKVPWIPVQYKINGGDDKDGAVFLPIRTYGILVFNSRKRFHIFDLLKDRIVKKKGSELQIQTKTETWSFSFADASLPATIERHSFPFSKKQAPSDGLNQENHVKMYSFDVDKSLFGDLVVYSKWHFPLIPIHRLLKVLEELSNLEPDVCKVQSANYSELFATIEAEPFCCSIQAGLPPKEYKTIQTSIFSKLQSHHDTTFNSVQINVRPPVRTPIAATLFNLLGDKLTIVVRLGNFLSEKAYLIGMALQARLGLFIKAGIQLIAIGEGNQAMLEIWRSRTNWQSPIYFSYYVSSSRPTETTANSDGVGKKKKSPKESSQDDRFECKEPEIIDLCLKAGTFEISLVHKNYGILYSNTQIAEKETFQTLLRTAYLFGASVGDYWRTPVFPSWPFSDSASLQDLKVEALSRRISGAPNFSPTATLTGEFFVRLVPNVLSKKPNDRQILFLLSDSLVLTKLTKKELRFVLQIPLSSTLQLNFRSIDLSSSNPFDGLGDKTSRSTDMLKFRLDSEGSRSRLRSGRGDHQRGVLGSPDKKKADSAKKILLAPEFFNGGRGRPRRATTDGSFENVAIANGQGSPPSNKLVFPPQVGGKNSADSLDETEDTSPPDDPEIAEITRASVEVLLTFSFLTRSDQSTFRTLFKRTIQQLESSNSPPHSPHQYQDDEACQSGIDKLSTQETTVFSNSNQLKLWAAQALEIDFSMYFIQISEKEMNPYYHVDTNKIVIHRSRLRSNAKFAKVLFQGLSSVVTSIPQADALSLILGHVASIALGEGKATASSNPTLAKKLLLSNILINSQFEFEPIFDTSKNGGLYLATVLSPLGNKPKVLPKGNYKTHLAYSPFHGPVVVFMSTGRELFHRIYSYSSKDGASSFAVPGVVPLENFIATEYPTFTHSFTSTEVPTATFFPPFLEQIGLAFQRNFKFGVLYSSKTGTVEEQDFYNTDTVSPDLQEFLDSIATKTKLDSSTYSGNLGDADYFYSAQYFENQIALHVGPLIHQHSGDPTRKRHIGNDVSVILFQDENSDQIIDIPSFTSKFNHVFIVVKKIRRDGELFYTTQVIGKAGVESVPPYLEPGQTLFSQQTIRKFLFTKLINFERHGLNKLASFASSRAKVRWNLMADLFQNYGITVSRCDSFTELPFMSL